LRCIVVVFHAIDAAEHFRQIERLDTDTAGLKDALGVANGIESRRPRAERADAKVLEPLHDAANAGKPLQVGLEFSRVHRFSVQRGERILDTVLHHVVACAHFAAEAVAACCDGHGVGAVGRGLHQYRNFQPGEADSIDDAALFAEVRQGYDDAIDFFSMLLEEIGAALRLRIGFHGAML